MKLNNKPISKLSFTVLSEDASSKDKNEAFKEIKRRFQYITYSYDAFMNFEEKAISKRGEDITKYLIQDNPTSQLLFEIYFNYVYKNKIFEHGNLLFSEVLLCNEEGKPTFDKFLKLELKNIKNRLDNETLSQEEINKLSYIYNLFYRKVKFFPQRYGKETAIVNCVSNIMDGPHSYYNPTKIEKVVDVYNRKKKEYNAGRKRSIVPIYILSIPSVISTIEFYDYYHMFFIAYKELFKIKPQEKSMIESLKTDEVDYSFVNPKVLTLKKRNNI